MASAIKANVKGRLAIMVDAWDIPPWEVRRKKVQVRIGKEGAQVEVEQEDKQIAFLRDLAVHTQTHTHSLSKIGC